MSWYHVFYLFSLADKISLVFGVICIVTAVCLGITIFCLIGAVDGGYDESDWKVWRRFFFTFFLTLFFSLCIWTFVPNRKDLLLIIAGGSVGEFVTNDPNAKQLPADITRFLRKEILEATAKEGLTEALGIESEADKLKKMSKEELIKIIQQKDSIQ